jgi:transposase InsO family protein
MQCWQTARPGRHGAETGSPTLNQASLARRIADYGIPVAAQQLKKSSTRMGDLTMTAPELITSSGLSKNRGRPVDERLQREAALNVRHCTDTRELAE